MSDTPPKSLPAKNQLTDHVIIAGYGIVGRCVAETLAKRKVPFCIVELNPATVNRLEYSAVQIILGDIRDESILHQAGISTAKAIALAMPDEKQSLEALKIVRNIRPEIPCIVRVVFTSAGIQTQQLNATPVVAEQVVAREFSAILAKTVLRE